MEIYGASSIFMEASSVLRAGLPFPESAARRHREKWTCIKEKNRKKITNMIPAREEIEKERALSRGSSRFLSRCRPIFEPLVRFEAERKTYGERCEVVL